MKPMIVFDQSLNCTLMLAEETSDKTTTSHHIESYEYGTVEP
jgi:hypothetical protein